MKQLKDILDLFFSTWKPANQFKFLDLCQQLKEKEFINSIHLAAILLKIPDINLLSYKILYEKYNLSHDKRLQDLPSKILIQFWDHLPKLILINPTLSLFLHNFSPLLIFPNSHQILPQILTLSQTSSFLIVEYIQNLSIEELHQSLTLLFSSKQNVDLLYQYFPLYLRRQPDLILNAINPEFNESLFLTSISSNYLGRVSQDLLAYFYLMLYKGIFKEGSEIFKALCIYLKKFFLPNLNDNYENLSPNDVAYDLDMEYNLQSYKPFRDFIIQTIEEANSIVCLHSDEKVEGFASDLIYNKNDDYMKQIATATISALILSYPININALNKLVLMMKDARIVPFPSHLVLKLLSRNQPGLIEKLSSVNPYMCIASALVNGKVSPQIDKICLHQPYPIIKTLYLLAVTEGSTKNYEFPPELLTFLRKVDFGSMKIPSSAPEFIKNYTFISVNEVAPHFYSEAVKITAEIPRFNANHQFRKRIKSITNEFFPDMFTFNDENPDEELKIQTVDSPVNMEDLYMTVNQKISIPDDLDTMLSRSGYHDSTLLNSLTSSYDTNNFALSVQGISIDLPDDD